MELVKTFIGDLVSIGFSPGMIVFVLLIVLYVRNPKMFDFILNRNGKNGDDSTVKTVACHDAMDKMSDLIRAENIVTRDIMQTSFLNLTERIDRLYEK